MYNTHLYTVRCGECIPCCTCSSGSRAHRDIAPVPHTCSTPIPHCIRQCLQQSTRWRHDVVFLLLPKTISDNRTAVLYCVVCCDMFFEMCCVVMHCVILCCVGCILVGVFWNVSCCNVLRCILLCVIYSWFCKNCFVLHCAVLHYHESKRGKEANNSWICQEISRGTYILKHLKRTVEVCSWRMHRHEIYVHRCLTLNSDLRNNRCNLCALRSTKKRKR